MDVCDRSTDCGEFESMKPSELFLWFLRNRDVPGMPDDHGWYAAYADRPNELRYVWRYYDRRLATVASLLKPGMRALEVGSGHGFELLWMALQGCDAVGIEPLSYLFESSRQRKALIENKIGRALQCEFRRENLLEMKDSERFDLIYLRETFHHLEPRSDAVRKLASLVSSGGRLVISEANAWNPALQALLFWRRGFKTIVRHTEPDGKQIVLGNERILTPYRLTRLFAPFKFESQCYYMRLLPTALARHQRLVRVAERLEHMLDNSVFLRPFYIHYEWVGTSH
jgi:SAM-dependent methyltransferase